MDPGFTRWIQNGLVTEILAESPGDIQLTPHSSVSSADHWYSTIIGNTVSYLQDNPTYVETPSLLLYIAYERSYDCIETNCVMHSSWSLHVKRINSAEDTVLEAYENGFLQDEIKDWIESLLEKRFPSITFDFESLIDGDILPRVRNS